MQTPEFSPDSNLAPLRQAFFELGQALGLPSLELDAHHSLSLVFESHLVVEAQASPETGMVFLLAALSALPALEGKSQIRFFRQLLAAPLTRKQMGGGFFTLDPESEEILLARVLPLAGINKVRLERELEQFVAALDYWNNQVKAGVLHFHGSSALDGITPPQTSAVRI